jgi:hypothetical protein
MRKVLTVLVLAAVMVGVGFLGSPKDSDATFHLMRVYGVMGGGFNNFDVQYVELRMTTGGQQFVKDHDICFYDAAGAPYAIFNFPMNAANGTGTDSILIGSSQFDSAWAVGSPDFFFNGSTVTQIATGADVFHPVRWPAGKVSFGTETATMPAAMCQAGFSLVDSIAYGTGYTATPNFPPKFNTDLSISGTQAAVLTGPLCSFCTFNNSSDYSLLDVSTSGQQPRNNSAQSGPLSISQSVGGVGYIPDATMSSSGSGDGAAMLGIVALAIVPAVAGLYWLRRRRSS